jgi:hypothetical protein
MANNSILSLIDAEIAKLTQVRSLLATTGKAADKVTAHLAKAAKAAKAEKPVKKAKKTKKRRVLSPEARERIAAAQRQRWAARKAK